MRAKDFHISHHHKLDGLLVQLCKELIISQKANPGYYGWVAAGVLDPDNNFVKSCNIPHGDKRVHAERNAIKEYEETYGAIPPGSIILTTLSPCSDAMDERYGSSCTDLINGSGVHKVYCGYMDPTQGDSEAFKHKQFSLQCTKNQKIQELCKAFADTFLEEALTEFKRSKPVTIHTNPYYRGATIGAGVKEQLPVTKMPIDQLQMWESDKTLRTKKVRDWVKNTLIPKLKDKGRLQPLIVWNRKGQHFVIDGNHRFLAYRAAGFKGEVPVKIVPQEMIAINNKVLEPVKENIDDAKCPPATQDITLNLKNRQKAIDDYGYGPLNPDLPNTKFWMAKVDEWNLDSPEEAKSSLCGNCAAFDQRKATLDCIAQGIGSDQGADDPTIDAGDLGYCRFLKFKCASRRTCDAWVTGGPLVDKSQVTENLRDWFGKEKWVRMDTKGNIKGPCARGSAREGKPKCLPQAKAYALGKKGRAAAAQKKRREDPDPNRRGPAKNVATKVSEEQFDENCWKGYHKEGNKKMFGKTVPNCVKNESQEPCPECGGAMYPDSMINEKQDACYYKVKSRYKVWPSAYASGALVQCRKKGAANWGNKSESIEENFADGKGPGRAGDSQRHGIPKGATMAQLEKAAKAPGRKGQLARWQINMRRGKEK